jgi:hypothetical protein
MRPALLCVSLASPVSANTLYVWCGRLVGNVPKGFRYHSAIIEIPDGPDAW